MTMTAIVTGAGSGIGQAIALRLAADGRCWVARCSGQGQQWSAGLWRLSAREPAFSAASASRLANRFRAGFLSRASHREFPTWGSCPIPGRELQRRAPDLHNLPSTAPLRAITMRSEPSQEFSDPTDQSRRSEQSGPTNPDGTAAEADIAALIEQLRQDRLWLLRQIDSGQWGQWRLDLAALERELGQLLEQASERLIGS